jgi:hypothetical protein
MNAVKWMAFAASFGLLAACPANGTGDEAHDAEASVDELDADVLDAGTSDASELDAGESELDADDSELDAEPAPDGEADADTFACTVVAPTECPDAGPRYADVAPIIEQRCVPCHSPEAAAAGGAWSLHDYRHVADWSDSIRTNLLACTMPPRDAGMSIPADESMLILTWLRCDLPR